MSFAFFCVTLNFIVSCVSPCIAIINVITLLLELNTRLKMRVAITIFIIWVVSNFTNFMTRLAARVVY